MVYRFDKHLKSCSEGQDRWKFGGITIGSHPDHICEENEQVRDNLFDCL